MRFVDQWDLSAHWDLWAQQDLWAHRDLLAQWDLWAQWAHFIRIETVAERNLLGHTCGYSAIY